MKPSLYSLRFPSPKFATLAVGAFSLCGLNACLNSPVEEEDFSKSQVTREVAGQSLAASFSTAGDWNQTAANPVDASVMQSVFASTQGLSEKAALAKIARISGDELLITVDTAAGLAHITHNYDLLGVKIEEKADAKWDDKAKDSIKDNENIVSFSQVKTYLLGKVETAVFADADGDGLVNAVNKDSKVKITFVKKELGFTETAVIVVGCGPDADFKEEGDNLIYQADWNRKQGATLKAQAAYLDGDSDGVVVNNADTSIVLVTFSENEPLLRPRVASVQAHAKVRLFGKDKGDQPMSFGYTETLKNGRVSSVSLKNRQGGEDLIAGDTMTVHLQTTVASATDTLKSLSIDIVMNPGSDLKSEADDKLYALHIRSEKKMGFERKAEFHFWADPAVGHGEQPKAGRFEGEATYANGQSASLKGDFSPVGFHAEYTGPQGESASVLFNLAGHVQP